MIISNTLLILVAGDSHNITPAFFSFFTVVFQMLWFVKCFCVVSRPADTAIILTNVSIVCTPKGDFENHTGAFDQTLFLKRCQIQRTHVFEFRWAFRYQQFICCYRASLTFSTIELLCNHSRSFVKTTLSCLCRSFDPFDRGNFARYRVLSFFEIFNSKLIMLLATSSTKMLTDKKENGVV